ncbi:MAG: NAD(P)/FAD-dependent oxidoreductase, partial [Planctomycetota bacterium]
MGTTPKRIAIIGAGTTGLATAAGLIEQGHDVTVFERFDSAQPIGAGLMLQPTGLACLDRLGLGEAARSYGARLGRIDGRTASGTTIFDIGYAAMGADVAGYGIHRGALFGMLHEAAATRGVPIHCGVEVASAPLDGDTRVLLDRDGEERGRADLVVDATGARSRLRARHAAIRLNRPYPYGAVWGVVRDPDGSWTASGALQQRYVAARIMIGVLPIGHLHMGAGPPLLAVFWSLPVRDHKRWRETPFAEWQAQVSDLWPEAEPLVTQFGAHDHLTWAEYSDVVLNRPVDQRLAFAGDAA